MRSDLNLALQIAAIGMLFLLTWFGALIWTIVGLAATRRITPPPMPYQPWPGPAPAGLG